MCLQREPVHALVRIYASVRKYEIYVFNLTIYWKYGADYNHLLQVRSDSFRGQSFSMWLEELVDGRLYVVKSYPMYCTCAFVRKNWQDKLVISIQWSCILRCPMRDIGSLLPVDARFEVHCIVMWVVRPIYRNRCWKWKIWCDFSTFGEETSQIRSIHLCCTSRKCMLHSLLSN